MLFKDASDKSDGYLLQEPETLPQCKAQFLKLLENMLCTTTPF